MRSALLLAVLVVGMASPARTEDRQAPAKSAAVRFDGHDLELAYEDQDDHQSIQEFLPAGETLDRWTRLAAIRSYPQFDDPTELAAGMLKGLREKYPQSPFKLMTDDKTGDALVDFVVWPDDGSFVEFNVFKYSKRPEGGLLSQQYALCAYADAETFLQNLRPLRERLVELMATQGLKRQPPTAKTAARGER